MNAVVVPAPYSVISFSNTYDKLLFELFYSTLSPFYSSSVSFLWLLFVTMVWGLTNRDGQVGRSELHPR